MTKTDFRNKIMIAYAGRASEQIKFNDVTTGASSDITQATALLKQYVEQLGFDPGMGLLDLNLLAKDRLVSATDTVRSLRRLSNELYNACADTLTQNYLYVETLAKQLLKDESIPGPRIERILSAVKDQSDKSLN